MANEWRISIDQFFRFGDIISIRVFTYVFASGAAHHNYWWSGFNVAGPCVGSFSLARLFDEDAARFLKGYCELDIKKQILALDETVDQLWWPEQDHELWDKFSHFNFDKSGLLIYFNPYAVLPYAYGAYEVHVPWTVLRSRIRPNLSGTPIGRLITD